MHLPMNVTLPEEMIADIKAVAETQERTHSWLIRKAWELAREQIVAQAPPVRSAG